MKREIKYLCYKSLVLRDDLHSFFDILLTQFQYPYCPLYYQYEDNSTDDQIR